MGQKSQRVGGLAALIEAATFTLASHESVARHTVFRGSGLSEG